MVSSDGSQEALFYDNQARQEFRGLTAELPDRIGERPASNPDLQRFVAILHDI